MSRGKMLVRRCLGAAAGLAVASAIAADGQSSPAKSAAATGSAGDFQPSAAKAAMLTYLSSHPQPIAGVVETAGMSSGIIQAFQQAGRPVPKFIDAGPSVGDLVYFKANPSKLVEAFTLTPSGVVDATKFTIEQLIAGHGPKISELASLSLAVDKSIAVRLIL